MERPLMNFQYSDSIIGNGRIDLVPYSSEHVEEYNKWLQCPIIQELTETEPCSLDEEFSYQLEWEEDNQKTKLIKLIKIKEDGRLIGDVNLFFQEDDSVEINLMIADEQFRGKGLAKEVLDSIIPYIKNSSVSNFKRIIAKILIKNEASIRFFEKYGFKQEGERTAFNEIILIYSLKQ